MISTNARMTQTLDSGFTAAPVPEAIAVHAVTAAAYLGTTRALTCADLAAFVSTSGTAATFGSWTIERKPMHRNRWPLNSTT